MHSALTAELGRHIVETLGLEVDPAEIDPGKPLFGPEGLGLDSIDALELVVMLDKRYGVKLTEMQAAREAFASLETLARLVTERRAGPGQGG